MVVIRIPLGLGTRQHLKQSWACSSSLGLLANHLQDHTGFGVDHTNSLLDAGIRHNTLCIWIIRLA